MSPMNQDKIFHSCQCALAIFAFCSLEQGTFYEHLFEQFWVSLPKDVCRRLIGITQPDI